MLTIFKIKKNSRPLTVIEKEWLLTILKAYANTKEGAWLKEVDYANCKYHWCDSMNTDNGVMGARPLFGNDIYIMPVQNNASNVNVTKDWIESIASVAIHELRHLWQQKKYGKLAWSVLVFPEKVIRPLYGELFIEGDAFDIEGEAEAIIQELRKEGKLG